MSGFSQVLNSKLKEKSFSCNLKCRYNWFKSEKSRKSSSSYFNSIYECAVETCKIRYSAKIHEEPSVESDPVTILVKALSTEEPDHPIETTSLSGAAVRGETRINLGEKILAKGVTEIYNELNVSQSQILDGNQ